MNCDLKRATLLNWTWHGKTHHIIMIMHLACLPFLSWYTLNKCRETCKESKSDRWSFMSPYILSHQIYRFTSLGCVESIDWRCHIFNVCCGELLFAGHFLPKNNLNWLILESWLCRQKSGNLWFLMFEVRHRVWKYKFVHEFAGSQETADTTFEFPPVELICRICCLRWLRLFRRRRRRPEEERSLLGSQKNSTYACWDFQIITSAPVQ